MADVESSMGGKFDKQAIPREARRLWAKLLQEPLRSEEALRGEVEAYSVLIEKVALKKEFFDQTTACLLYTSPSPRDRQKSRMPSSA